MSDEFLDAYSDDQISLELFERIAQFDHPPSLTIPDHILHSTLCRLWATMLIGSIECMIQQWASSKTDMGDIYEYFQHRLPNDQRLNKLRWAFERRRIDVDEGIFKDLLAIKYIRNAYIHTRWNPKEVNYVGTRGFPRNVNAFTADHLARMKVAHHHAMTCLGKAMLQSDLSGPGGDTS